MDKSLEDSVNDTELVASFVKDAMTVALSEGLSVPSLRYDSDGRSIKGALQDLDGFVEGWNLHSYSAESVGVGVAKGSEWNLTNSETKWLIDAIDGDDFDTEEIQRKESPDFVCGDTVGVEVKSNKNYKISRKQLQAIADLDKAYVYYVTRTRVKVLDTFDWIGLNEYNVDR